MSVPSNSTVGETRDSQMVDILKKAWMKFLENDRNPLPFEEDLLLKLDEEDPDGIDGDIFAAAQEDLLAKIRDLITNYKG